MQYFIESDVRRLAERERAKHLRATAALLATFVSFVFSALRRGGRRPGKPPAPRRRLAEPGGFTACAGRR
jgi:hypothetical protein